jgi:hypothetical protein
MDGICVFAHSRAIDLIDYRTIEILRSQVALNRRCSASVTP